MAWCGCSRKGRQSLASSGGGGAGWSVCTSTPYILWRRRSSKALRPFSGDVYGWVFCAKNWQLADHGSVRPLKVFAQDETRLGLLPVVRRRVTACGVQPVATVTYQFDNFYLYGAVEPTTGASFFLALPSLNSRAFQRWLDGFAAAFPESL